jgi:hypothetical protein
MRYVVALASLLVMTSPAIAQDRLDALAIVVNQSSAAPKSEAATVERMAKTLGTGADALRAEQTSSGLGWGDLFLAHRVASRGGHPVDKVIAARRSGANWTEIAEEASVDPDKLVADVVASWPDAARVLPKPATPAATPAADKPEEKDKAKSGGVFDFLRGKSASDDTDKSGTPAGPPPRDEITDRMLRGAGQKQR